jgi:putative Ca2+/H+ antiporter (TMEM165/GDT1 family)
VEAFLIATGVVALAEIGDKTQLLALVLAARFRRPLPIIAGIFWLLVPDKVDETSVTQTSHGVFVTTVVAFFLAEMGDKTQIATIALAARFSAFYAVVSGTTLGMMIANVPAVLVGHRAATKLPVRLVHAIAAAIFVAVGIGVLFGPPLTH